MITPFYAEIIKCNGGYGIGFDGFTLKHHTNVADTATKVSLIKVMLLMLNKNI